MNKTATILLASTLTFTSFWSPSLNVLADPTKEKMSSEDSGVSSNKEAVSKEDTVTGVNIGKEEAISIFKGFFEQSFEDIDVHYDSQWYMKGIPIWNVRANVRESDTHSLYYSATIDAESGEIYQTEYNHYNRSNELSFPPKISWEDGKKKSASLIIEKFNSKIGQIKLDYTTKPTKPIINKNVKYTYRYIRSIDGVPFPDNHITIHVNGNGEMIGYRYRWVEKLNLQSEDVAVTKEQALDFFNSLMPLSLAYQRFGRYYHDSDQPVETTLLYKANLPYPYLDASSGEFFNHQGKSLTEDLPTFVLQPLVEKELPPLIETDNMLTQEEAQALSEKLLDFPENLEIRSVEYQEYGKTDRIPTWNLNWENKESNDMERVRLSLNALSGEVVNLYMDGGRYYNIDDKTTLSYSDAKEKAIATVKHLIPSKAHLVGLQDTSHYDEEYFENTKRYHFQFNRLNNGVPYTGNGINITVSAVTGDLLNLHSNWNQSIEFPSNNDVVTKEEAMNRYLDRYQPQLEWVTIQDFTEKRTHASVSYRKAYVLKEQVQFSERAYIDAKSGDWHSYETGEPIHNETDATDIEGLEEENELQLLISYGALTVDKDGKIYPHKSITRGEMVKMLMLTNNPNPIYYDKLSYEFAEKGANFGDVAKTSEYFPYVEEALRQGFINGDTQNFNPDEKVTRYELAQLLVNALKYDELAKRSELFSHPYSDIESVEYPGFISLVHHLKILPDEEEDNKFGPSETISRANASQAFYNYLKTRSELN